MSVALLSFRDLPPFRPHSWFRSGHAQTILGAYWWGRAPAYRAVRHETLLDDGDRIVLHDDRPAAWASGHPVALIVHGLGGTHASPYVVRTADKLHARGVRTFRMDLRGCGAGAGVASLPLHAGRSEDAAAALAFLISHCPASPVFAIGFSMGANIVLKMAGEMADAAPEALQAVIAVAPPIDLAATSRNIALGFNRVYDRAFVRSLLRHVENRRRELPEAGFVELRSKPRGIYEFDNLVTAPLSGFAGADDYYARASAGPLLQNIRVPTLMIAAADDPLIPVRIFDAFRLSPAVQLHVTEGGGHVGYLAAPSHDADRRWLDWRLVEQVEWLISMRTQHVNPRWKS
jgi:predicted alpha/beta-fold hydrolase